MPLTLVMLKLTAGTVAPARRRFCAALPQASDPVTGRIPASGLPARAMIGWESNGVRPIAPSGVKTAPAMMIHRLSMNADAVGRSQVQVFGEFS
ncbi:hypothetical protein ACFYM0_33260 [Streptomyces sp. NPDC006487]|uniref:hypothetical protein n=1 Tax=Streptomyces sp. NPDC006487 TaxID=3364748 RepID=UPI0036BD5512